MFILELGTQPTAPGPAPEVAPVEVAPQPVAQPEAAQPQSFGNDWETEKAIYQQQLEQKDAIINGLMVRQPQQPQPQAQAPQPNPDDPFAIIGNVVEEKVKQALGQQFQDLQQSHTNQQQLNNFQDFVAKELPGKNAQMLTPLIIQNAHFLAKQGIPEQIAIRQAVDLFRGGVQAPQRMQVQTPTPNPQVLQSSTDYGTQVGQQPGVADKLEQASKDLEGLYNQAKARPSGDSAEILYSQKANAFRGELSKAKALGMDTSRYELKLRSGWK